VLDIQVKRVDIPFGRGSEATAEDRVVFQSPVRTAQVVLKGFDTSFNNGDHDFAKLVIDCEIAFVNVNEVRFQVRMLLRDASGNIDDPFGGSVNVAVIADLV